MAIFFIFGYIHNIHKDGIKWKEGKQEGGCMCTCVMNGNLVVCVCVCMCMKVFDIHYYKNGMQLSSLNHYGTLKMK
jgi:hypothetical protein